MPENSKVVRVTPDHPDSRVLHQAGDIIRGHGVVIFPAQFLYGLAADAADPAAVEKIFRIKQRPRHNPILVLVRDRDDIPALVQTIPPAARTLMDTFWPGSLTLVFEAGPGVSRLLTAGTGKIGIRQPVHPVARALVNAAGRPITGTSANLSGSPGCTRVEDLPPAITEKADLILDAGPLKGGTGSTIADITTDPVAVLRRGAVAAEAVHKALKG